MGSQDYPSLDREQVSWNRIDGMNRFHDPSNLLAENYTAGKG
jgi:hypothetical protein